jgi:hypothetical protein
MDEMTSVWFDGMWHGALASLLFIFAIIGWPATKLILGLIFSPFTHRAPRKPLGSKFWDQYSLPNAQKRNPFEP